MSEQKQSHALIALGTNLSYGSLGGASLLVAALTELEAAGLLVLSASSAWKSAAWPPSDQPDYVNAAARLGVGRRTPLETLDALLSVERMFGRVRDGTRWAARTLDLDLLDHDDAILDTPALTLPHPRLATRAFVLAPLAEIAPDWRPGGGASVADLLAATPSGEVRRLGPLR